MDFRLSDPMLRVSTSICNIKLVRAYTIVRPDWTGLDSVQSRMALIKTAVYIQTVNITIATQAVSLPQSKIAH